MQLFGLKQQLPLIFGILTTVLLNDANAQFSLSIAHINDHHSHLAEETFSIPVQDLPSNILIPNGTDSISVTYGGFPRLVAMYHALTANMTKNNASSNNNLLTLHAGDAIVGTLFYTISNGTADAEMMKYLCFDAMTLGNHEFDSGDSALATFLTKIKDAAASYCPNPPTILSANLHTPSSPLRGMYQGYTLYNFSQGEVVAVVGLTTETTKFTSRPDANTTFANSIDTAQQMVSNLTAMGVNKIVMMTHVGFDIDIGSIAMIDGVDVVIGGHSHTLLGNASDLIGLAPEAAYPTIETRSTDNGKACVVQAWCYGHAWGMLDVQFDASGNVLSCTGGPHIPINGTAYDPVLDDNATAALTNYLEGLGPFTAVTPDGTATSALQVYANKVNAFGNATLATVQPPGICLERIPGQGYSMICTKQQTSQHGGAACDIVAQAFLMAAPNADVAIQNAGGCRTDIFPGNYTVGDAFTMLPFGDTLITLEMTGAQIVQLLNEAINVSAVTEVSTGGYPYASGLRYNVDASLTFGNYVSNLEVNSRLAGNWTPIDLNHTYTVLTNSYSATGGDNYLEFTKIPSSKVVDTRLVDALSLVSFVEPLTVLTTIPTAWYSTQSYIGPGGASSTSSVQPGMSPSAPPAQAGVPPSAPSGMSPSAPPANGKSTSSVKSSLVPSLSAAMLACLVYSLI